MSLADNFRVVEFPGRGTGIIRWDNHGRSVWEFTMTGENASCMNSEDKDLWPDQAEAELRAWVAKRFSLPPAGDL